ncbi:MAG: hypothetical protein HHJ12_07935 [Glaciimonas sp.]|nr:hypothetical protein [Glaciimonas sp.]
MSASASKMTIKRQLHWSLKALIAAVAISLASVMAFLAYDLGRSFTGFDPGASRQRIAELEQQVQHLTNERDRLSIIADAADSSVNMERSAQQQLALQVKNLSAGNAQMKDDLAFFESLLPTATGPAGINIRRLTLEMAAPGQLRYRFLAMQGGRAVRDFSGTLQLAVTMSLAGKELVLLYPEQKSAQAARFKLDFKHYQRVDGVLTLPAGAAVKKIEARVLQQGKIQAHQSANL